jgi:hypothetical protein
MKELRVLLILVSALFVVGGLMLVLAHYVTGDSLGHHLLRDVGIALLISALVTVAYEAYARTRFDLAKIESLLDTVYGSDVPAGIWNNIKETLLKREVLRRNSVLHVRIRRDAEAGPNNVVLEVDLAYDVLNLLPKNRQYVVVHGLDEHIVATRLPRFIEASIGDEDELIPDQPTWTNTTGNISIETGRLRLTTQLSAAKDAVLVPIRVRRNEVRSCPGSYYLIMSEITDGMTIYLDECAADVKVSIYIYPAGTEVDLNQHRVAITDAPLLPGHCIEFKIANDDAAKQPVPAPLPVS